MFCNMIVGMEQTDSSTTIRQSNFEKLLYMTEKKTLKEQQEKALPLLADLLCSLQKIKPPKKN